MPGRQIFRHYLHSIFDFDRSQLAIKAGLRKALVVGALLLVGVLIQRINIGSLMALGALVVGFADQGGAYRPRAKVLLLVCVCTSFSALVGGTLGKLDWAPVALLALWGFAAGMLVAISQAASGIGSQSVVILALATSFTLAPLQVVGAAGLLLLGGLIQTVASLTLWPLRRNGPERDALVALYQKLATNAALLPNTEAAHQCSDALAAAGSTIADSVPRYGSGAAAEVFQGLLSKAWGIYLQLTALVEAREGLAAQQQAEMLRLLDQLQATTATLLRAIASGIEAGKAPGNLGEPLQQIQQTLAALRQQPGLTSGDAATRSTAATALKEAEALSGKLRAAARIATSWEEHSNRAPPDDDVRPPPALQPQSIRDILRANLTLRSATLRHAIRMSAVLALTGLLSAVFPLPHDYWTSLTVVMVLRPNYSVTISRGLARGAGTLLGGVCVGLLFVALKPDPLTLTLITTLLIWGAMSVFLANYAVFAFFLTAFIAALVSLGGAAPLPLVQERIIDTFIGTALSIGSIIIWPTWARVEAQQALATLLEANCAYFTAIMDVYMNVLPPDTTALRVRRLQARLARSNAEALVQRSLSDPARYHTNVKVALGTLESAQRFMRCTFAIEALRQDALSCQKPPELATFSADVQRALHLLSHMIADGSSGAPLPPLRQQHQALAERLEAENRRAPQPAHCAFLVTETDHIVDSINSIADLLSTEQGTLVA